MNTHEIEQLFERYLDGITTEAEEQTLRECLTQDDATSDLKDKRRFLLALEEAGTSTSAFDVSHLEKQIDHWEAVEQTTRHRTLQVSWRWFAGIAACFAIALMLPIAFHEDVQPQETVLRDTYDDPKRATEEAQLAMAKFSECLNKGFAMLEDEDTRKRADK